MKKLFKQSLISLASIFVVSSAVHATSYQIFSGINFANPAALNSVKQEEVMLGGMGLWSRFRFIGTAAGVSGSATSNTVDLLPYGRVAVRLSPKWVIGLDVTQPYYTNIQYPANSIVNMFATKTILRDTNYSPKISYQATERLAVGLGFDANNFYEGQLNFVVPPLGNMVNKASSWAFGFDAGLFYVLRQTTFLNLAYYSKIVQHSTGYSTWGNTTNNGLSADIKLPATWIANIIQMMSPAWALSGTIRYVQWNTVQNLVLQNTALGATITVPEKFYNNISTEIATRYQINNKWAVLGAFDWEPNVQPTYTRNVGLPTYTRYIPAVGAEYEFLKGLKAKLVYAYIYSRPPINMSIAPGVSTVGRENVNVNALDLSFSYSA